MDNFFNIIEGILNGIKSAWSLVKNCVLTFTQKTISLFKKDKTEQVNSENEAVEEFACEEISDLESSEL